MKRSLAIGLAVGVFAPVAIISAVSMGATTDTDCWDEYNNRGTRLYRTIAPKGVPVDDCTPGDGCKWGYKADGRRNRLYVPHDSDPATACEDAPATTAAPTTTETPPTTVPSGGGTDHFGFVGPGGQLPSDAECAAQVRPMTENRPDNSPYNQTIGTRADATYPRVTGAFTGTTDEIIQWTACKWGIDEDWVRAQIAIESNWDQTVIGDFTTEPDACAPGFPIGNYDPQYNGDSQHQGECPESIGLGQVRWLYHGSAFADGNAVQSSAYNLDYTYAVWRKCFEGGFGWLNDFDPGTTYTAGDSQGCLGVWFSGRWYNDDARGYIDRWRDAFTSRVWEQEWFGPATTGSGAPTTTVPATTVAPPATTVAPPATTIPVTTTTVPVTTTTVPTPPTTSPPPPAGVRFVETFDDNVGLERFDQFVFHRNMDIHDYDGWGGGTWTGDHDLNCGGPTTQRTLSYSVGDSQETRAANSLYSCRNHMMSAMGDVDGYSIVAFSPKQTFDDVSSVEFDVSLTDLGNRQWLKFGVLSTADCPELDTRCMYSDVFSADLPASLATPGRLIFSWSGGLSAGYPGGMKIGDTGTDGYFSGGDDKATRHPVSIVDNDNGTVTFTVAGEARTAAGSFPECPCRVVFYDHDYTPDKNEWGPGVQYGYTYHWDNIIVR